MDNKIEKLLKILYQLNLEVDIVEKSDFDEQYENVEDFKNLTNTLDAVLNSFNYLNKNDANKVEEMLFEFHRILTTYEWHFAEISNLNTKILKMYKEKLINR